MGGARSGTGSRLVALAGLALGVAGAIAILRADRGLPVVTDPPPVEQTSVGGDPLPEDRGAIGEVVVHLVPALEPVVEEAYRDFLGSLDPSVGLLVIAPRPDGGSARGAVDGFLGRIDPSGGLARRARVVDVEGPISLWSKDRAIVLGPRSPGARSVLAVPARPDGSWRERANDWATPGAIAAADPARFEVRELPLDFDAGDFAVTGDRVIVDVNLLAKNRKRGLGSVRDLREIVRGLLGLEVVVLGTVDGHVPRHHLSMYMAPIGDGVVLVGDPEAAVPLVGAAFAPGSSSPETGAPLVADLRPATVQRFARAAADLARAGFRVERVPTVAFDDKTYLAYTNGVFETRGGRRIAWMPVFGVPALDAAARATYERLGWEVRPVRVEHAYPFHGTIGCLANVLARAP